MELSNDIAFARQAVVDAAELLKPFIASATRRSDSTRQKAAGEVVTEADQLLNDFLIRCISDKYPNDAICAEEGSAHDNADASRRWIIDPIDGTRSFIRGVPGFSVLLALAVEGEPVLGVVHDPLDGTTWFAARGMGVHRQTSDGISPVVAAVKPPKLIWSPYADATRGAALREALGLRSLDPVESFGLRAVELALDGAGVFASRPGSPHLWDTASAYVIVKEAGGVITGYDGNPLVYWQNESTLHPRGAVASLGLEHASVLELIETYLPATPTP